jgi:hypothetical protein
MAYLYSYMNAIKKILIRYCAIGLLFSFSAQLVFCEEIIQRPPAQTQTLNIPSFAKPLTASQDDIHSIEVYIRSAMAQLRAQRKEPAGLTCGDFNALQNGERRIAVKGVSYADNALRMLCSFSGRLYEAVIKSAAGGEEIEILRRGFDWSQARYFPAAAPSTPLSIPPDTMALVDGVNASGAYSAQAGDASDYIAMRDAFIKLLQTSFIDYNLFDGIPGAGKFFQGIKDDLSASSWLKDESKKVIAPMLDKIGKEHPEIRNKLARLCRSMATIFYRGRKRHAYSESAFFYGLASRLAPDNMSYLYDYASALYHAGGPGVDEARRITSRLLEADPANRKFIALGAYAELNEARRSIKALEGRRAGSMESQELIREDQRISALLMNTHALLGMIPDLNLFARGLEAKGIAHILSSRLRLIKQDYAIESGGADTKDLSEDIIYDAARGIKFLNKAYRAASASVRPADEKTGEMVGRAREILQEGLGVGQSEDNSALKILARCWDNMKRQNIVSPAGLDKIERSLKSMSESINHREINGVIPAYSRVTFQSLAGQLSAWAGLQKHMTEVLLGQLKECGEEDAKAPDAFFEKVSKIIAESGRSYIGSDASMLGPSAGQFDIELIAKGIKDFYVDRRALDSTALAVLHVRFQVEKRDLTLQEYREYIELALDVKISETPEQFGKRLRNLARVFDFDIADEKQAAEEAGGPRAGGSQKQEVLDRATILGSIEESNPRSLVSRVSVLKKILGGIRCWENAEVKNAGRNYFLFPHMLFEEKCIAAVADDYKNRARAYLGQGTVREAHEQRERKAMGARLWGDYGNLTENIEDVESLVAKRQETIRRTIVATAAEMKAKANGYKEKYGGMGLEWFEDRFVRLYGCIFSLTSIAEPSSDDYASYDAFDVLWKDINGIFRDLEAIKGYEVILGKIEDAKNEAALTASFFGPGVEKKILEFTEQLDRVEGEIFDLVNKGEAAEGVFPRPQEYYNGISMRTVILRALRNQLERKIFESLSMFGINNLMADEQREMARKVVEDIKSEIASSIGMSNNIITHACNINAAVPTPEVIDLWGKNLAAKAGIIISANEYLLPLRREAQALEYGYMSRMAPGTVEEDDIEKMERVYASLGRIANEARSLNMFGEEAQERLDVFKKRITKCTKEYYQIVLRINKKWFERLAKEVEVLRRMTVAWLDNFIPEISPELKKKMKSGVNDLSDAFDMAITDTTDKPRKEIWKQLSRIDSSCSDTIDSILDVVMRINRDTDAALSAFAQDSFADYLLQGGYKMFRSFVLEFPKIETHNTSILMFEGALFRGLDVYIFAQIPGSPDKEPPSPVFYSIEFPRESRGSANAAIVNEAMERLRACHGERCQEGPFSGLAVNPILFMELIQRSAEFYATLAMKSYELTETPLANSIDLKDCMLYYALKAAYEDRTDSVRHDKAANKIFEAIDKRLAIIEERMKLPNSDTNDHVELQQYATALRAGREKFVKSLNSGLYDIEGMNYFLKSVFELMKRSTGRSYAIPDDIMIKDTTPRFSLTLPKDGKPISVSPVPVTDDDYSGVYFNSQDLLFRLKSKEAGAKAALLCQALNKAKSFFINALFSGEDISRLPRETAKWAEAFANILEKLKERDAEVVVAKNIPTRNSICVGSTIIFDKDFLEYLIPFIIESPQGAGGMDEAARIMLGERIFHELGLISNMDDSISDSAAELRSRIVLEEEEQLYKDTLFYKRIFSHDQHLYEKVDRFAHMQVKDRVDMREKKFSDVFQTANLFTKIQRWAKENPENNNTVRYEMKLLVLQVLDQIKIPLQRYVRLFPAAPRADRPGREPASIDYAAAVSRLERLAELDNAVLDDRAGKSAPFYGRKRRIAISAALIPDCQRSLINEINEQSKKAFDGGWTSDLVEIKPFSYLHNIKSDEKFDTVLIMDSGEASRYGGSEKKLCFTRSGDYPIYINGLIGAGRAVLYGDTNRLYSLLKRLSGDANLDIPAAGEMEEFIRMLPVIALPPIRLSDPNEMAEFNKNLLKVLLYA